MKTVGLFEAKQKLSELVERARGGEEIGITRRGKLSAVIVPARPVPKPENIAQIFAEIATIRKRAKPLGDLTVKDLIEEGRR
jgi:prevent-host-death family protein